jgi:hypothetical protein
LETDAKNALSALVGLKSGLAKAADTDFVILAKSFSSRLIIAILRGI